MRVLVMCTVHDPRDARISERQIAALLAAGHTVTQAGPFTAFGATSMPGVQAIDLPRAHGRHRVRAWWAARRLLHRTASEYDVNSSRPLSVLITPQLCGTCTRTRRRHWP